MPSSKCRAILCSMKRPSDKLVKQVSGPNQFGPDQSEFGNPNPESWEKSLGYLQSLILVHAPHLGPSSLSHGASRVGVWWILPFAPVCRIEIRIHLCSSIN